MKSRSNTGPEKNLRVVDARGGPYDEKQLRIRLLLCAGGQGHELVFGGEVGGGGKEVVAFGAKWAAAEFDFGFPAIASAEEVAIAVRLLHLRDDFFDQ